MCANRKKRHKLGDKRAREGGANRYGKEKKKRRGTPSRHISRHGKGGKTSVFATRREAVRGCERDRETRGGQSFVSAALCIASCVRCLPPRHAKKSVRTRTAVQSNRQRQTQTHIHTHRRDGGSGTAIHLQSAQTTTHTRIQAAGDDEEGGRSRMRWWCSRLRRPT